MTMPKISSLLSPSQKKLNQPCFYWSDVESPLNYLIQLVKRRKPVDTLRTNLLSVSHLAANHLRVIFSSLECLILTRKKDFLYFVSNFMEKEGYGTESGHQNVRQASVPWLMSRSGAMWQRIFPTGFLYLLKGRG